MTAVATTARATLAAVIAQATGPLGRVSVHDHDPSRTAALGPVAVVVAHDQRERHVDRYVVRVEVDPQKHTAPQLCDRVEQVTETVDQALRSALPGTWNVGTWTMGFEADAVLFVASCELVLPTDTPAPETYGTATVGTLAMTAARTTIADAVTDTLVGFAPSPKVYSYMTWPGNAVAPVAVVVSPLGLDADRFYHQVAVLISGTIQSRQAQEWLDDIVWQLDDGLRSNLPASFFLAGPGTDEENGWDKVGWIEDGDLQTWAAQLAVGRYR